MRISDWSADVCSSDLIDVYVEKVSTEAPAYPEAAKEQRISGKVFLVVDVAADGSVAKAEVERSEPDRKSVVEGKSVSVRVDLGGRRIIKQKKSKTEGVNKVLTRYLK